MKIESVRESFSYFLFSLSIKIPTFLWQRTTNNIESDLSEISDAYMSGCLEDRWYGCGRPDWDILRTKKINAASITGTTTVRVPEQNTSESLKLYGSLIVLLSGSVSLPISVSAC